MPATEQNMSSGGTAEEQAIPADDNETFPSGIPMGRVDVHLQAEEVSMNAQ